MRRFFCASLGVVGDIVRFDDAVRRHIRVLRLAPGEEIVAFDDRGHSVRATLEDEERARVTLVLEEQSSGSRVVLILGTPKKPALEDVVRMCTEAGVSEICIVDSNHSVSRSAKDDDRGVDRLDRIAQEAARQSEAAAIPAISRARDLPDAIARIPPGASRILCSARNGPAMTAADVGETETWIAIGPEGGFAPGEEDVFTNAGFRERRIGFQILRVATAAAIVVGVIRTLEMQRTERA